MKKNNECYVSFKLPRKPVYTEYTFRELNLKKNYENVLFRNGKAVAIVGSPYSQNYSLVLSRDAKWVFLEYMDSCFQMYKVSSISREKPVGKSFREQIIHEYKNRLKYIKEFQKNNKQAIERLKLHDEYIKLLASLISHVKDNQEFYKWFKFDDAICNKILDDIKDYIKGKYDV